MYSEPEKKQPLTKSFEMERSPKREFPVKNLGKIQIMQMAVHM